MNDTILEAYEKIGLSPCQDFYYIPRPEGGLCCPLTALALAEKAVVVTDPLLGSKVYAWALDKYGQPWVLGFQDGWDWRWPGVIAPKTDPNYVRGFDAGKAAVKALVIA